MAGYIPRWYTRPKTVTHPSTNRARRGLTSFMRRTPMATTPLPAFGACSHSKISTTSILVRMHRRFVPYNNVATGRCGDERCVGRAVYSTRRKSPRCHLECAVGQLVGRIACMLRINAASCDMCVCRSLNPTERLNRFPAPLKLRPYGAIQICCLLLLLLFFKPTSTKPQAEKLG